MDRPQSLRRRSGRAKFRRATAWQDKPLHERIHELEPVAKGHLAHPRDLRDRLLRASLSARQGGQVDRGRRGARGREGHRTVDLLQLLQDLQGLRLDRRAEAEPGAEPADVVRRAGRRDAQREGAQEGPVRLADRFLADTGHLLKLVEGSGHAVDSARGVYGRRDDCLNRSAADEALLEGLLADETGFVLHRLRKAHEGCDPVEGADRLRQAPLARSRMAGVPLEFSHAVELLPLPQRDRVPSGVLVRQRDYGREAGRPGDVAPGGPRPGETVVLLYGIGGPLGPLVDRALTDHKTAGIAHEFAARIVPDEMLTAALGTCAVLFDDRRYGRAGGHGPPGSPSPSVGPS